MSDPNFSGPYHGKINGVSHANLTRPAYALLTDTLRRHGNTLSALHEEALWDLCDTLTRFAQGTVQGRRVYALSTGMGKTSAIIAWITALHRLGATAAGISVAVSASKVEALASIKRALMANGVPEGAIGLKHSLGAAASLPSTGDDDRRFVLVTHQRVRGGGSNRLFTQHKGKPRDVLVYDESLLRADCLALSERDIRSELASAKEWLKGRAGFDGVLSYLEQCRDSIVSAVEATRAAPDAVRTVTLPELIELEQVGYADILQGVKRTNVLRELVPLSGSTLRVAVTGQNEGILWHQVVVPEELRNVLVLDASHPIRKLCQMDPTLAPAGRLSDFELKRFEGVTVHQMLTPSGRYSTEKSFSETRRDKRALSREICEVVKRIPADEGILLFTFKRREGDRGPDIRRILLDDLRAAGVDVEAKLPDGRARVVVTTWGNETGFNDWSYVGNVILAGIIHRDALEIAAAALGQLDDKHAALSPDQLRQLLDSEAMHSIFQALSRGRCREIDNGQAKPMNAWVPYPRPLAPRLGPVMPGAKYPVWAPVTGTVGDRVAWRLALAIWEHLKQMPNDVRKVSSKKIKEALAVPEGEKHSYNRATALLGQLCPEWVVENRSLVRIDAEHYGFTQEPATYPAG